MMFVGKLKWQQKLDVVLNKFGVVYMNPSLHLQVGNLISKQNLEEIQKKVCIQQVDYVIVLTAKVAQLEERGLHELSLNLFFN